MSNIKIYHLMIEDRLQKKITNIWCLEVFLRNLIHVLVFEGFQMFTSNITMLLFVGFQMIAWMTKLINRMLSIYYHLP